MSKSHAGYLDKIKVIVSPTSVVVYDNIPELTSGHFSFFMESSLNWTL